ncbi:MAG: VanZ family protein [Planctomycetota bacterium]
MTSMQERVVPFASGDVSSEPIINAVHRRLPEMLLAAYLLLLVYCCFIPFEFGRVVRAGLGDARLGLYVLPISIADILFNIGAYVPVGAGLFFAVRRRLWGRVASAIVPVIVGTGLSFLVEEGQVFDRLRVPSWIDVVSNGLGSVLGVCVGLFAEQPIRRLLSFGRSAAARNWWLAVAYSFVCFVLVVQLRPFDVVPDVKHTAKVAILRGDASPLAQWDEMAKRLEADVKSDRRSGTELTRMRWEYTLDRMADVALYAAIAALLVVGLGRAGLTTSATYFWSMLSVMCLAACITVLRIFLISHGLDTATLACALVAWPIGAAIGAKALYIHRRNAVTDRVSMGVFEWPRPVTTAVAFMTCGMTIAYGLAPFDFDPKTDVACAFDQRACLVPFLGHFGQRANLAAYNISTDLLRFGALGAVLSFVATGISSRPWRRRTFIVVMATMAASVLCECVHLYQPTRHCDITKVILAGMGAFSGAIALRWVMDFRRMVSATHVEDMLTTQLIEGRTYEAVPVTLPRSRHAGVSQMDQE